MDVMEELLESVGKEPGKDGAALDQEEGNASDEDDTIEPGVDGQGQGQGPARAPPPYLEVADQFGSLEATAAECVMDKVSNYLRLAKMQWIREVAQRQNRQSDIRDFFDAC